MRERVAGVLHRAGALQALMRARQLLHVPTVSIITYHHLHDDDPGYPFDPEVADATPAQFRWQMETLARYCTPIGIDDLLNALDGGSLPPNPVMVTFDDGYQSCHDIALPILRAVGVRATFFIATSYISERRLYWWEQIAMLVSRARRAGTITYPRPMVLAPRNPRTRVKLDDLVKDTPNLDLPRFLREISVALGVEWTPETEADAAKHLIMTWDQVRALAHAGMDIESHSRNHRVLQTLDAAALHSELAGSRADLETQLGRRVRAIAYPVGRRLGQAHHIRKALTAAGYQVGLTNASGVNVLMPSALRRFAPIDRLDVRRLSIDRSLSDAMFLTQIALPQFGYYGRHQAAV
jgi:peptidoglycan/xylan/chitin deacetylase (PgdA/CDA1 family)